MLHSEAYREMTKVMASVGPKRHKGASGIRTEVDDPFLGFLSENEGMASIRTTRTQWQHCSRGLRRSRESNAVATDLALIGGVARIRATPPQPHGPQQLPGLVLRAWP